jgi:selenocysteine lyase/cysteine desulfurase
MNKAAIRRELFPVTSRLIYLNHAAVGPLSEPAFRAMEFHAHDQRDFGALHWREWLEEYAQYREEASRLIGARPAEISILKNTSEGISFVAEGMRWREGDNVVTSDMEFPSNFIPWKRQERRGVECRIVKNVDGAFSVEDVARLIDDRTRVVALSSVYFHNGFAIDLDAIGELCASRGVHFFVDAIQSLGALRVDVRRSRISFLAADGHKWMLGPEGTAIFYVAEEVRDELEVLENGWMNVDRKGQFIGCPDDLRNDGRRFEAGSLNTNGIFGATAAIELLNQIGVGEIERDVLALAQHLGDGLERIGFEVKTPRPYRSGIVAAVARGLSDEKMRKVAEEVGMSPTVPLAVLHMYLERERVVCAPREGMLRFAPHFYNTEHELDELIELLEALK